MMANKSKQISPLRRIINSDLSAAGFLLPAIALVGLFMYYPMGRAVWDSLFDSSFTNPTSEFVGFDNYREMLGSKEFRTVVRNSVFWTFGVVILQNLVGLAVAILLNQDLPFRGLTRALLLLPWVLPGVVAALLWRFMYDPQLGLVSSLLTSAGLAEDGTALLADPDTAMIAVVISAVWKGFPFSMLMFLAALQAVPEDQMDAAKVDGASAIQRFRFIVLPAISRVLRLNLLLTTIFTFNYFDMIWVTTGGGPLGSTHIFPTKIFEIGFGEFRFGLASTYGVAAVILLSLVAVPYIRELNLGRKDD